MLGALLQLLSILMQWRMGCSPTAACDQAGDQHEEVPGCDVVVDVYGSST